MFVGMVEDSFTVIIIFISDTGRVIANSEAPKFLPGKTWVSIREVMITFCFEFFK